MTFAELYEQAEIIGCLTFATVNNNIPETRIAHFTAYDEEGLYFMTMFTKPFYRQLSENGHVSVCGLAANSQVGKDTTGMPSFEHGWFLRISGSVRKISLPTLQKKAQNNPIFESCVQDVKRYPAMVTFCLYKGTAEIFDYDFEKTQRPNKIERQRFSFGDAITEPAGLQISDGCIACGQCYEACTFNAIEEGSPYRINGTFCDECGNCVMVCPVDAVIHKGKTR